MTKKKSKQSLTLSKIPRRAKFGEKKKKNDRVESNKLTIAAWLPRPCRMYLQRYDSDLQKQIQFIYSSIYIYAVVHGNFQPVRLGFLRPLFEALRAIVT